MAEDERRKLIARRMLRDDREYRKGIQGREACRPLSAYTPPVGGCPLNGRRERKRQWDFAIFSLWRRN
jgi:hypothetical protein